MKMTNWPGLLGPPDPVKTDTDHSQPVFDLMGGPDPVYIQE